MNADETSGILQPNFRIYGADVDIRLVGDVFQVNIGCQHPKIAKENVEQMLKEAQGGRRGTESIKIILPTGSTKTVNSLKSVPIFMDEGADYWISKNKKIYAKDAYEVVAKDFQLENDYFTTYTSGGGMATASGHSISREDVKKVIHVLTIIQDYYAAQL